MERATRPVINAIARLALCGGVAALSSAPGIVAADLSFSVNNPVVFPLFDRSLNVATIRIINNKITGRKEIHVSVTFRVH